MVDEIHHPHDMIVRAVLSDLAEATSFLQRHLPQEVSQALNWSTLTLLESSFVDEYLAPSGRTLLIYDAPDTSPTTPSYQQFCQRELCHGFFSIPINSRSWGAPSS